MPLEKDILRRYSYNKVFVETGTCQGSTLRKAVKAGYEKLYSIEVYPKYYDNAVTNFKNNTNVTILFGDSGVVLEPLISTIGCPITFFLDAHGRKHDSRNPWPLLDELRTIERHPIKTHIILIDDVHKPIHYGENLSQLCSMLLSINKKYRLSLLISRSSVAGVLLVAEVPRL